ncbi:MAG: hypothetical protein Q7R41_08225 [Phycisphaerales bacterium]|nr:hypothetical protein [Phycisphaerales bacterium]
MKPTTTIIIDTREQCPLRFENLPAERGSLDVADYSVRGLEHRIGCERKSLPDLVMCCGSERERFVRALERLQGRRFRCVVVESTLAEIEAGGWRGRIVPQVVLGSIASWSVRYGLPFFFCGDPDATARFTERWLFQACRCIVAETEAAVGLASSLTANEWEPCGARAAVAAAAEAHPEDFFCRVAPG